MVRRRRRDHRRGGRNFVILKVMMNWAGLDSLAEAHSIGAMGKTGRGVCEHTGVDPKDVDIMMGTFTKSFGSCGGYIAGKSELVDYLTSVSPAHKYAASMSPACAEQIIGAMTIIMGKAGGNRGTEKIRNLHENANYFRSKVLNMGMGVLGDWDSPVVPIMVYNPGKLSRLSRKCFENNVAIVVVGFPATTLLTSRARVCISAAHTREDLDFALEVLEELADEIGLRYRPICSHQKLGRAKQAVLA